MDALALGLSLGLGAGLAPGPLLVLVVAATLERGLAAGCRIALAPLVSDAPIVALSTLVLRELPKEALAALSLAGAAFVAWLAYDALRGPPPADDGAGGPSLRRAVLANALSPHPWIFWATVGGPLLVEAGDRSVARGAAFLAGFYLTLVGAKVAVALLVHGGRGRGARLLPRGVLRRVGTPKALAQLDPTRLMSATLLGAVAVALAVDAAVRLGF